MNKTVIAAVVVAVVLIGGFIMFGKSSPSTGVPTAEQPGAQTNAASEGTLKTLFAMTGSHTCTIESSNADSSSKGTVYVSNGTMRGDFVTSAADKSDITSHMIVKGTDAYVWGSAMPQGIKVPFDVNKVNAPANTPKSFNLDESVKYSCSNWTPDESMFSPPADITFMDAASFMPPTSAPGAAPSASIKAQQCKVCDSLTGSQQGQCKAALGCK